MFTVTRHFRPHPNESGSPKTERFGCAQVSQAAHEISNSSAHRFDCIRRRRQPESRMSPVSAIMDKTSQKFARDHSQTLVGRKPLHDFEAVQNSVQFCTVRKLQGSANQLVDRFAHVGSRNPALPMASSRLKLANEVKVTQLENPSVLPSQTLGTTEVVANQSANSSLDAGRKRLNKSLPVSEVFPADRKNRIEEERVIAPDRLHRAQVERPKTILEAEPKPIDQENQRPLRKAPPRRRLLDKATKHLTKAITQSLRRHGESFCASQTFETSRFDEYPSNQACGNSPSRSTTLARPNGPRFSAQTALPTPGPEAVNFRTTTRRFRMYFCHAYELSGLTIRSH